MLGKIEDRRRRGQQRVRRLDVITNSASMNLSKLQEIVGFLGGSAGKESTCKVGGLGLIPGLGRSTGEEKGYQLQYYWASLVTQTIKNVPTIQETWVRSLDWKDPLEKGTATHSSILAWRILWTV